MPLTPVSPTPPEPSEGPLELDGPFWRFSLQFYAKPGISAAFLKLQDEADVDVIHALLTIYASLHGKALSADDLTAARHAMAAWRVEAVLPLRSVRRTLKERQPDPGIASLRSDVKKAELLAEQIQIAMAERWLRGRARGPGLSLREGLEFVVTEYNGCDSRDDASLSAAIDTLIAAAGEVSPT